MHSLHPHSIQGLIENVRARDALGHGDLASGWTPPARFWNRRRRLGSVSSVAWRDPCSSGVGLCGEGGGAGSAGGPGSGRRAGPSSTRSSGMPALRRLLGVPLYGPNGLLGVLHVGSLSERTFGAGDMARMEELAAGIGQRLSEQSKNDVHLAALALQRSLLPAAPPSIEGLDLAVRYLPAEGDLGGDWYDIFVLPSGKVGLVMGDVEGHGLRSAVVMERCAVHFARMRSSMTTLPTCCGRLDRKLCHFEGGITATVIYAVTQPPTPCSSAPPATRRPDGWQRPARAHETQVQAGLILGVDPATRTPRAPLLALEQGDALVFYTDDRRAPETMSGQLDGWRQRLDLVCRAVPERSGCGDDLQPRHRRRTR